MDLGDSFPHFMSVCLRVCVNVCMHVCLFWAMFACVFLDLSFCDCIALNNLSLRDFRICCAVSMALLSFFVAEVFLMSGIFSLLVCTMVMSRYVELNVHS